MGYPMNYRRVVCRNGLQEDYAGQNGPVSSSAIAGDLRRLEKDQVDENHLELYAKFAGITEEQASMVLHALFHPEVLQNIKKDKPWQDPAPHNVHGESKYE